MTREENGLTGVREGREWGGDEYLPTLHVCGKLSKITMRTLKKRKKVEGLPVLQSEFRLAWATK